MVEEDLVYVRSLIQAGVIDGPVLELGAGYDGTTCRAIVEASGLNYFGTDMVPGPNVNFVADFENPNDMVSIRGVGPFGAVLILNVLEHTFDPIRILDNAAELVRPNGALVVLTPAIWPLHNFPMDAWRPLPNFYQEYAKRRDLQLVENHFQYIGYGAVNNYRSSDGSYSFPPPGEPGLRRLFHRGIHKMFNTFGRSMRHPSHLAVGAVFVK